MTAVPETTAGPLSISAKIPTISKAWTQRNDPGNFSRTAMLFLKIRLPESPSVIPAEATISRFLWRKVILDTNTSKREDIKPNSLSSTFHIRGPGDHQPFHIRVFSLGVQEALCAFGTGHTIKGIHPTLRKSENADVETEEAREVKKSKISKPSRPQRKENANLTISAPLKALGAKAKRTFVVGVRRSMKGKKSA
ncbi:hypothetical protein BT96DRAFT_971985 [Gymnopus androsaceus JB14]|uniref:Uncharacterized protein n=1 Tax=Gymnopus androsaceus JB14 TaxID=1447944 RepID=A0A6A4IBL8_9AGAR|nr:hypothetical protein BT96DRAFT_971985 [Gymnopus androsaceus JB14]